MKFVAFLSLIVVIGRLLITPRLNLPTAEGCYESFAHLFVGGLFGAWLNCVAWGDAGSDEKWLLRIAIALSLFELAMFLIQKTLS